MYTNIKLSADQCEVIVREELRYAYVANLKEDWVGAGVDHKLLGALLTVIEYYSSEKDFNEWKKKVDSSA